MIENGQEAELSSRTLSPPLPRKQNKKGLVISTRATQSSYFFCWFIYLALEPRGAAPARLKGASTVRKLPFQLQFVPAKP